MIEINLLPEELRKPEGTPAARLLVILFSVVLLCCMGALLGNYYVIRIPNKQQENQTAQQDITRLEKQKKEFDLIRGQIGELNQKVTALNNLTQSRLLYGRLLDRLCSAMQIEGCWLRSFSLAPDTMPAQSGGKRMLITLTGYTTAATPKEMGQKVTDVMSGLCRELEVLPEKEKPLPGQPWPKDLGWCKALKLRFDSPKPVSLNLASLAAPAEIDPKALEQSPPPKEGVDFQMTIAFETPAPN